MRGATLAAMARERSTSAKACCLAAMDGLLRFPQNSCCACCARCVQVRVKRKIQSRAEVGEEDLT